MTCPECKSTKLTWTTATVNLSGVVDGRLRMNEVGVILVLGCEECSATVRVVDADGGDGLKLLSHIPIEEGRQMTFADRVREAALAELRQWNETRRVIEEIVLSDSRRGEHVGDVIKVDDDSYAVEVISHRTGSKSLWTTVYRDRNDHMYFNTVDLALLHLIGLRHSAGDAAQTLPGAATYAARVLRVPTDE